MIHEIATRRARLIVLPFRHLESEKRVAMVEGFAKRWLEGESDHWEKIDEWIRTLGIKGIGPEVKKAIKRLKK